MLLFHLNISLILKIFNLLYLPSYSCRITYLAFTITDDFSSIYDFTICTYAIVAETFSLKHFIVILSLPILSFRDP